MKELKELLEIANKLDKAGLTKEADQIDALAASLIKSGSSHSDMTFSDAEESEPNPALKEAVKKELFGEVFDFTNDNTSALYTIEEFEGILERLWDIADPKNVKHQDQIIREVDEAVFDVSHLAKGDAKDNLDMFRRFLNRYK